MKRVLGVILSSLLGLVVLTTDAHAGRKDAWKIGHVRPRGASIDTDARKLAEAVAKDAKGRIVLDVVPESGLADYSMVTELVSLGYVEMFIGPFGTMVDKRAALPLTPYLVTNWTEAKRVFSPGRPMLTSMGEIMERQNIKILGGWPVYFGGIVLRKEPPNPGNPDFPKGLLLRTPPIVSLELTAQAMGYRSYPITWAYARAGLKTGMVDGLLGGGAEGYADLHGAAKYYIPAKDHFEYWFVYMNLDLWKGTFRRRENCLPEGGGGDGKAPLGGCRGRGTGRFEAFERPRREDRHPERRRTCRNDEESPRTGLAVPEREHWRGF